LAGEQELLNSERTFATGMGIGSGLAGAIATARIPELDGLRAVACPSPILSGAKLWEELKPNSRKNERR
jgi:hypothetical protein